MSLSFFRAVLMFGTFSRFWSVISVSSGISCGNRPRKSTKVENVSASFTFLALRLPIFSSRRSLRHRSQWFGPSCDSTPKFPDRALWVCFFDKSDHAHLFPLKKIFFHCIAKMCTENRILSNLCFAPLWKILNLKKIPRDRLPDGIFLHEVSAQFLNKVGKAKWVSPKASFSDHFKIVFL